jgi:hypothetical protein
VGSFILLVLVPLFPFLYDLIESFKLLWAEYGTDSIL